MASRAYPAPLDRDAQRRHKARNAVQTVLLLGGMAALLALCAWIVAGPEGIVWAVIIGAAAFVLTPRVSPRMVLAMYRGREISPRALPNVFGVLDEICRRADLERRPRLFYVPSAMLNAFAVGDRDDAAIAVTGGMLRALSLRELAGVLAHEVSHIRNNDLRVMGLADLVSRLTSAMSTVGMVLLIVNLPLLLADAAVVPWPLVALLVFAPTLVSLLQLALSRAREYEADLDAAGLTGDPDGLASALAKLQRYQGRFWEEILMPGRRMPDPSLLRTHPPTEERIRRLMSLRSRPDAEPFRGAGTFAVSPELPRIGGGPRWRTTGVWY